VTSGFAEGVSEAPGVGVNPGLSFNTDDSSAAGVGVGEVNAVSWPSRIELIETAAAIRL
jgi:hypothetical protein